MNLKTKLRENARSGAIGAAVAILLGMLFLTSLLGDPLSRWSYDLPLRLRPDMSVTNEKVLIIYMDDVSAKALGENPKASEWNRRVHTRLLNLLTAQGAELVIFDVLFDTPAADPKVDADLARAMKANGRIVVAAKVEQVKAMGQPLGLQPLLPIEVIQGASSFGVVELPNEHDRVRLHYYPTKLPCMALQVARMLGKYPTNDLRPRWINYYGPRDTLPSQSYSMALDVNTPTNFFAGKRVFIGQAPTTDAKGTKYETLNTPLGEISGVEVLATTCLNFLRNDWITEMPRLADYCLFCLGGVAFGFGFVLIRPVAAAGLSVAGFLALGATSVFLLSRYQVVFPWLIIGIVQIPAAFVWSLLANTKKLYREKEVLERTLATATSLPRPAGVGPAARAPVLSSPISSNPADSAASDVTRVDPTPRPTDAAPQIPDHDLVRCIGKGAYGEVWLARDAIGTYHAVKIVYRRTFSSELPFEREFKGIQKFTPISRSHPGFVHILHVGRNQPGGYFYYIMEAGDDEVSGQKIVPETYVPKNLAKEIDRRQKLPLEECLQLSLDLASSLDYLHQQQLVHRDIKPSNIIFVNGLPKVADIGLVTDIANQGREVTYLGTEGYIPPEGPGTPAADVYSLGKVIYEAGMGRTLGHFPALPTTLIEKPDYQGLLRLSEIILKACAENYRVRYQTMAELRADLLRLQEQVRRE